MMRVLLIALLAGLVFLGCESQSATSGLDAGVKEVNIPFHKDGTLNLIRGDESYLTLNIEIAEDDSSITRGLMQRSSMPDLSGMLFLMPVDKMQNFWMSNTTISLDIIFINGDMEIVHIAKYTTPLSPDSVSSQYPAAYVLEVIAGFADTQGIIEGDKIAWQRHNSNG